jgi:archaellum biogenesis protein FlaJ (TadC family)
MSNNYISFVFTTINRIMDKIDNNETDENTNIGNEINIPPSVIIGIIVYLVIVLLLIVGILVATVLTAKFVRGK